MAVAQRPAEDEDAIRAVAAAWVEATRQGDVPAVLRLMTDDALFLVPGQPAMDKAAFESALTGAMPLSEFLLARGYEVHGIKRRASMFNTERVDHIYEDPHVEQQRFVLHHRSDNSLSAQQEKPRSVLLVIGPEGGLSEKEIAAAQAAGCSALTLGPRVLRTETAPLAAISVLQARWGDFQ